MGWRSRAAVAPFDVVITPVSIADPALRSAAEEIYESCRKMGLDALFDDRDERPGVKFKDADLIGIPYRITIGKKLAEGMVEVVDRRSKTARGCRPGLRGCVHRREDPPMTVDWNSGSKRIPGARTLDLSQHGHLRPVAAPCDRSRGAAFRASR